jgi:hypothetical protein
MAAANPECTARWVRQLLETFQEAPLRLRAGPIIVAIFGSLEALALAPMEIPVI